ncbi:MAG: protein kinase [Pyrinomonadaceae bacterium]
MLVPNHLLQNRYRIIGLLGQGGMGHVYEALDNSLDLTVAIKETFAQTDSLKRAFEREAKLLAKLQHSVLPRVSNHFIEGDGQFLVMDYIQGHTLLELLDQRKRPFTPAELLPWIEKLLQALEYLHDRPVPVIHRDIKPANVKVDGDAIYLLDFGLAKGAIDHTSADAGHTLTSVFGYTAAYAPVEQIMNTGTTARSDLYSLGATIYHLITGTIPVKASLRYAALDADQPDPLIPADQYDNRIPTGFATVLSKAMAVKQKERYASAAQMRTALRAVGPPVELMPSPMTPAQGSKTLVPGVISEPHDPLSTDTPPAQPSNEKTELSPDETTPPQLTAPNPPPASSPQPAGDIDPHFAETISADTQASPTKTTDPLPLATGGEGPAQTWRQKERKPVAKPDPASSSFPLWTIGVAGVVVVLLYVGLAIWARRPVSTVADRPTNITTAPSPTPATTPKSTAFTSYAFVQDLPDQEGTPWSVAISHDGKYIASGSSDGLLRVWVTDPIQRIRTVDPHEGEIYAVAFSPDGKQYAFGGKGRVVRLDENTAAIARTNFTLKGHTDAVTFVAFSPDGKLLASASRDETVRLWNTNTGELVSLFEGKHTGVVWSVAFSPDGKYLASAGADKSVVVWNISDHNAEPIILNGFDSPVEAVAFSPDGKIMAASGSIALLRIFNASNFSSVWNIELPWDREIKVTTLAFSPDSQIMISASYDGYIRVWKAGTSQIMQTFAGPGKPILAAAISSDMKMIVSGGEDGKVKIWR